MRRITSQQNPSTSVRRRLEGTISPCLCLMQSRDSDMSAGNVPQCDDLTGDEAVVAVSGEAVGVDGVTDASETRLLLADVPLLDDDMTLDGHAALDGDHTGSTDPAIIL